MRALLFGMLVAVAGLTGAGRAGACSLAAGYVIPSNYELVERADAIAIATVVGERPVSDHPRWKVAVFRLDRAIKGPLPPGEIEFGALGVVAPSDPDDILSAHEDSLSGACVRQTFEQGRQYVLFLERDEASGDYSVGGAPFSRIAEDYQGDDSLWIQTIRTYLQIQAETDPMQALDVLAGRLAEMQSRNLSAREAMLARDIEMHLASRSPYKPTQYLVESYEALERGEPLAYAPASWAGDEATYLANGSAPIPNGPNNEAQKAFILNLLVDGGHAGAQPLFDQLVEGAPSPGILGAALRFYAAHGQVDRAYHLFAAKALPRLGAMADADASALVRALRRAMHGTNARHDQPETEAWRASPEVASAWPELSLSLYWDMLRRGGDAGIGSEIDVLRPADYRARPEVTLALTARFDDDVERWAIGETARLASTADFLNEDDPIVLPLRVLVVGFGEERDGALLSLFCAGDDARFRLIRALGAWGDSLDLDMLDRIAMSEGLDDDDRDAVTRAYAMIYGREAGWDGETRWFGIAPFALDHMLAFNGVSVDESVSPLKDADPIACPPLRPVSPGVHPA